MRQDTQTYENEKSVRIITKDNGETRFCLSDIAKCAGYKAPDKFCARCGIKGEKLTVSWERKTKGIGKARMDCVSIDEYDSIAERYGFPKELSSWMRELAKRNERQTKDRKGQRKLVYEINEDDLRTDFDMILDMLNNLTYACLELKRELEKAKRKAVGTDD